MTDSLKVVNLLDDLPYKLNKIRDLIRSEYLREDKTPWVIAYSGGKDSSLLLHLVLEQLAKIIDEERTRHIYVVSNDTLVESPLVDSHLHASLDCVKEYAQSSGLPVSVNVTTPKLYDSFWVNLIGRGYPTPNRTFRWCTDRLKIEPTSGFIKEKISASGSVIMLLGTRLSESNTRAKSISKFKQDEGIYSDHSELPNCKIFTPIVDLTDDEVWTVLLQDRPPWGGSYRNLITLYKNARGGECPTVLSKAEAPSCGTTSPRFGCWVCTVVTKDKSLEGLIDSGFTEFEDLAEFRDWLVSIRDMAEFRLPVSRNGRIRKRDDGSIMPGAFTLEARKMILDKLEALQAETGSNLIHENELREIGRIWKKDKQMLDFLDVGNIQATCYEQ